MKARGLQRLVFSAALTGAAQESLLKLTAGRAAWERQNFRGNTVSLAGGVAAAAAAVIGAVQQQLDYFDRDYLRFLICALCGGAFGGIISTGKKTKNRRKRPAKVYGK